MIGFGIAALVAVAVSGGSSANGLTLGARSAISNQVITMAGPGVTGTRITVTVGGKRAKVLSGKGKRRFVVPSVRPGRKLVVVKTAKRTLRALLTIRKTGRFTGRIRVALETGRTARATLGPAGGTVSATSANGTKFKLTVPAGALPNPTVITATPVKAISGLPVKSKRISAVQFGPEGLVFATPARLEIDPAQGSPSRMAGFSYEGSGANVGFQPGKPSGKNIVLDVGHFSGEGAFERSLDDFLLYVGVLVQRALAGGILSQSDVEFFIDALRSFRLTLANCRNNPTCDFLDQEARKALIQLGAAECTNPETARGSELVQCIWDGLRLEAAFQLLGLDDSEARRVIRRVHEDREKEVQKLVRDVQGAAEADPMGNYENEIFLTPRARGVGRITDREPDSHVSNAEIAQGLAGNTALLGGEVQTNGLNGAVEAGLRRELDRAKALCETDVRTAKAALDRILKYTGGPIAQATSEAIVACVPKVKISPTEVTVVSGRSQAFNATANDGETTFTWSASGGSITQTGAFTAPTTPGDVTVTVALPAHPEVRASATVHVTASGYTLDNDELSVTALGFAGCPSDSTVVNSGRVITGGLSNFDVTFEISASRPCSSSVSGAGRLKANFSRTSSPLRMAFGLLSVGAASTNAGNPGGTDGVWLLVRGAMDFDFGVGATSKASCTADFHPDFLHAVGDPHVTISSQANPAILHLGPTGQVQGEVNLPPGDYHLSALGHYQGDNATGDSTSNTGAYFTFSCEVTPA